MRFTYQLGVCPSMEQFVLLMLKVCEPDLEELTQGLLSELGTLSITYSLESLLVKSVSH